MQGAMRLSLRHEPDFFVAAHAGNLSNSVFIGRDRQSGAVVASASRSVRRAFVDGQATQLGYLSSLRIDRQHTGGTLLARGFRILRKLHDADPVPYTITAILDGNSAARHLLTSQRTSLPVYRPAGKMHTHLISLERKRRQIHQANIQHGLPPEQLPEAIACINNFNSELQFAPQYQCEDFQPDSSLLPSLRLDDFYLFRERGRIRGVMAVWDQRSFKQEVVAGYSPWLSVLRPLSNFGASFGLAPRLPAPGQTLPCMYAACMGVDGGDCAIFTQLLDAAIGDLGGRGLSYLLVGLSPSHPFSSIAAQRAMMKIASEIFLVYWKDAPPARFPAGERIPHLEIATL